ncbi:MAG: hypothetical protein JSW00_11395 [Thermoplasmata archaeon]|nr:MAG: hypothetical protein JSW00_11395 [Thermoplasmata archaeon]
MRIITSNITCSLAIIKSIISPIEKIIKADLQALLLRLKSPKPIERRKNAHIKKTRPRKLIAPPNTPIVGIEAMPQISKARPAMKSMEYVIIIKTARIVTPIGL